MILTGSLDTDVLVFDKLSGQDLVRVSCSSPLSVFQKKYFWLRQLLRRWTYHPLTTLNPQLIFWRTINYIETSLNTESSKPLCIAASQGDLEMVHFFSQTDKHSYFAIIEAIHNDHVVILNYLLQPYRSRKNKQLYKDLVRAACWSGNWEIVQAFLRVKQSRTDLFKYTIKSGNLEILQLLNQQGFFQENYISNPQEIFSFAVKSQKWPMINHFITLGYCYWGVGLYQAIAIDNLEMTKYFMEKHDMAERKEFVRIYHLENFQYKSTPSKDILDYLDRFF